MSEPALKPWSQCDDEFDTAELDSAGSDAVACAPRDTSLAQRWLNGGERKWPALLNLSPFWSIVPFGGAAAWMVWTVVATSDQGIGRGNVLLSLGLLCVGLTMLILAHFGRRAAVDGMLRAIQFGGAGEDRSSEVAVQPDLRPIWNAVEAYTNDIERKVKELADEHRRLSLELTLAGAQRRLSADIFATLPDPLLILDSYGQLIQSNQAANDLFGLIAEESIRKPIESLIVNDDLLKTIRPALEADFRAAERRVEFSIGDRSFGAHIVPLTHHEKNEPKSQGHGLVVLLRDITRERETSRKKSEFVAHVAHELRTPLASIRAYVEMLVDGEATDEKTQKEYYDIIQTSAARLGRLIDNMLNISRIEAGTVRINKEPIAISMIVKEACDMMRPSADERSIKLLEHLTPVMYRVMADRDLIYQSVLNLISNAIKYTREGGEVNVRMTPREENKTLLIEVQDTGVGIPKEDLPRMFQKFFRVEANKDVAKGTGLGLNLVKNIVESVHGGQVTLTSEVGVGSTFGIVLPLMTE